MPLLSLTPAEVRAALLARDEIALLDLREEDPFAQSHPLWAANLPLSRKTSSSNSNSNSFAQTRHPYGPGAASDSSSSFRSGASSSVIRLATREDNENMPYVLNLRGTAESLAG